MPASLATAPQPICDELPARKPRGNPNLNLSPRCGAMTRAGCACRAPAVHGKLRCRMHGGRSTGPRTPDGMQRLRDARTVHGRYGAEARTRSRQFCIIGGRMRVHLEAMRYQHRLPPELAARLHPTPPEFGIPPYPAASLSVAQDRALRRAEAEALAPWRQAIAAVRAADKPHAPDCPAVIRGAPQPAVIQPRSVALGRAADSRACRPETRADGQKPMHQHAAGDGAAGQPSAAAPRAADSGAAVHVKPWPVSLSRPRRASAAASVSIAPRASAGSPAEPHAPERPRSRPSAPAHPPSESYRAAAARPRAPVAVTPVCCLSAPRVGATQAAGTRQRLLASTGAGSLALSQAFAVSFAAGRAACRVTR